MQGRLKEESQKLLGQFSNDLTVPQRPERVDLAPDTYIDRVIFHFVWFGCVAMNIEKVFSSGLEIILGRIIQKSKNGSCLGKKCWCVSEPAIEL